MKPNLCVSLLLVQVATWFAGGNHAAAQTNNLPGPATQPQMLDLSRLLRERFVTPQSTNRTFQNLVGVRHYDGLPFRIEGRGWLYGRKEAQSAGKDADHYPDFTGVAVGRAFEELHLLHGCRWQEGEGQAIAIVRLNYADGTRHEWPIRYGAHVRDWQRMPSEEHESLSDTNTKATAQSRGLFRRREPTLSGTDPWPCRGAQARPVERARVGRGQSRVAARAYNVPARTSNPACDTFRSAAEGPPLNAAIR